MHAVGRAQEDPRVGLQNMLEILCPEWTPSMTVAHATAAGQDLATWAGVLQSEPGDGCNLPSEPTHLFGMGRTADHPVMRKPEDLVRNAWLALHLCTWPHDIDISAIDTWQRSRCTSSNGRYMLSRLLKRLSRIQVWLQGQAQEVSGHCDV